MRTAVLLLTLIFGGVPARAAEDPFAGWTGEQVSAHRTAAETALRARVKKWMSFRKEMYATCMICKGLGRVPFLSPSDPDSTCSLCKGSGLSINPKVDYRAFLGLLFTNRPGKPAGGATRKELMGQQFLDLRIRSYVVSEVRVLGNVAAVFSSVRPLPEKVGAPKKTIDRSGVEWWVLHEGEWYVLGPWDDPKDRDRARYPSVHLPRPNLDPAVADLVTKGRSLQYDYGIPTGGRLTFTATCRTKGRKKKARYLVTIAPPARLRLEPKSKPEDRPPAMVVVGLAVGLSRLLSDPVVPDPAEFHCRAKPGATDVVVFAAFTPERFPDTREVRFAPSGLPVELRRPGPGASDRFTWEERKGVHLLTRIETAIGTATFHYRPVKERWVPDRVQIHHADGECSVALTGFRLR